MCNDQTAAGSSSLSMRSSQSTSATRHPMIIMATSLLELALNFSQENPVSIFILCILANFFTHYFQDCIALIYDELAHLINEEDIDERLQIWVKDNMTSDFTEYYVAADSDADAYMENLKNNMYIKLEPERRLNIDEDDCEIVVKIFELIYNPDMKAKKQVMVPMSSIFNLMQSCEKKLNDGSLQDVDALFGCGIILFKTEDLDDISSEEVIYACDMLFYTINW